MRIKLSITTKISAILLLFILTAFTSLALIYYYESQREADATIINIAGRQRMLSQRIAKLAFAAKDQNPDAHQKLNSSYKLYNATLERLHKVISYDKSIDPSVAKRLISLLNENYRIWRPVREKAAIIVQKTEHPQADPVLDEAIQFITAHDDELLLISDQFTSELTVYFESRMILKKRLLLMMLGINFGIFFFGFYKARQIARPLTDLADAAYRVGKGDFREVIVPQTHDEVQALATVFNNMIQELKNTTVSKNYVDNIIQTMIDSLIVTDTECRILKVNNATCRLLEYTEEEILCLKMNDLTDDLCPVSKLPVIFKKKAGESVFISKGRKKIPVIISAAPMEAGGFVILAANISLLKETENELRKAKEMAEEATKIKDKFVWLVAHDLKSPFISIIGWMNIICRDSEDKISEKHRVMMGRIEDSCKRLIHMIDRLLNVSITQSGLINLRPENFDARDAVDKAIHNCELQAEHKKINIVNLIPPRTIMFGDFDLLSEVLYNLLINAVKFSRRGTCIKVFVPNGRYNTIAVQDEGEGIDERRLSKIFKYDEKCSTPGTEGEPGSGLGLPLCMDIMRAHNGTLLVESVKGSGSTFYAQLPEVTGEG